MSAFAKRRPVRLATTSAEPIVITGGAGFIGSNLADSLLKSGEDVIILDNLSRQGVRQNLSWLVARHGERVHPLIADVRNSAAIAPAFARARAVFHFAAQTAVTTSLADPVEDFEVNARGTLNVLEAVRRTGRRIPVIFSSTNKVYGGLADLVLTQGGKSCEPQDASIAGRGVSEARPLAFATPYGCAKGTADQYVLDYAQSYGLPTAVLRMSCIYGPRQFGTEDQGWVAHFLLRALSGERITIFGDGRQVRDILHVEDAVAAYRGVLAEIGRLSGQAFNLGGGPANAVSLRALLAEIADIVEPELDLGFEDWRACDQRWFVADTGRLAAAIGWSPRISWRDGVRQLAGWLRENRLGAAQQPRRVSA